MIEVTIYKDPATDGIMGFHTYGHAEYADAGYDIICSAVSAIVITTVNSIEQLTTDQIACQEDQEHGEIHCMFLERDDQKVPGEQTELLFRSMILGLSGIEEQYGSQYLKVTTKEV